MWITKAEPRSTLLAIPFEWSAHRFAVGSPGPGSRRASYRRHRLRCEPYVLNDGDYRSKLFVCRLRVDDDVGSRIAHSGMFPCLRFGTLARFVRARSKASITRLRVVRGSMTSSM